MIFKLLGGLAVVFAALVLAIEKNTEAWQRIKKCKALLGFISECKLQIECFSLPLCAILDAYGEKWREGAEFMAFAKREGMDPAAQKYAALLLDGAEEREIFCAFASGFGRGYCKEEAARCGECVEKLKILISSLQTEASSRGKVRITLFVCVSLMVVLFVA